MALRLPSSSLVVQAIMAATDCARVGTRPNFSFIWLA